MRVLLFFTSLKFEFAFKSILMQVQIISEKCMKLNCSGFFLFASAVLV